MLFREYVDAGMQAYSKGKFLRLSKSLEQLFFMSADGSSLWKRTSSLLLMLSEKSSAGRLS